MQKIEIPESEVERERLMKKYDVDNVRELRLAIYREYLKRERYKAEGVRI